MKTPRKIGAQKKRPRNIGALSQTRLVSRCGTPPDYFFFLGAAFFFAAFLVAFFIDWFSLTSNFATVKIAM